MHATLEEGQFGGGRYGVVVEPQKAVHTGGTRYRADFFVYLVEPHEKRRTLRSPLVVEVDGHAFHEKTRFQAANDKRRDRAMVAEGFRVVRFAGSEVYNQPEQCAGEVDGLMRGTAFRAAET